MVAGLVEALGEGMQVAWRRRWMRGQGTKPVESEGQFGWAVSGWEV